MRFHMTNDYDNRWSLAKMPANRAQFKASDRQGEAAEEKAAAYCFFSSRRLKKVRRGKKNQRPAPSTDVAGGSPRHRRPHHAIKSSAMSVLPILDQRGQAA
jgi:hypothetical protein